MMKSIMPQSSTFTSRCSTAQMQLPMCSDSVRLSVALKSHGNVLVRYIAMAIQLRTKPVWVVDFSSLRLHRVS